MIVESTKNMVQLYPEEELVAGCQKEKPTYQRALYRQYHRKMYGICLRYTDDAQDAQDILQEGFIKVFRSIKKFRSQGSLEGWIRRIMIHTAIEHYRRRSRYFMVDMEEAEKVELETEALSNLSRDEILHLIQQLPPGYRTVFNLYCIEGYSHREISLMLNISEGTSKSQLSRAKALLQKQIRHLNLRAAGC